MADTENPAVLPLVDIETGSQKQLSEKILPQSKNASHMSSQKHQQRSLSEPEIVEKDTVSSENDCTDVEENGKTDESNSKMQEVPVKDKKYIDLKKAKKEYRREQKLRAEKMTLALTQSSSIILTGWLKVRGPLKSWVNRWFVLRKGVLIFYKDPKDRDWLGTVFLHGCLVTERPSKKDGFCFKIYHPYQNAIYGTKGAKGETLPTAFLPIHVDHCILRAPNEHEGKLWIQQVAKAINGDVCEDAVAESEEASQRRNSVHQINLHDEICTNLESLATNEAKSFVSEEAHDEATLYVRKQNPHPSAGDSELVWADESKGLIWSILKQVRPGMDLTRVVLPTFILEPRSFLQKMSDYYFHADILCQAAKETDSLKRMIGVCTWYISGFHIKPKGMKKPYNPILGESFRCRWAHSDGSFTHFVAEQVSHHPPVSAFYCSNRQNGFVVNGAIAPKSKYWGNSAGSVLEGRGVLTFTEFQEDYHISYPSAICKGIFVGTLTMEMIGNVTIECPKTGLKAEIEFKAKPLIGGAPNQLSGKIKLGKESLGHFSGSWEIGGVVEYVDEKKAGKKVLLDLNEGFLQKKLPVDFVKFEDQGKFESEKLWSNVTDAIEKNDQVRATEEKKVLEDAQREAAIILKQQNREWNPKLFDRTGTESFVYKYLNTKKWDPSTDCAEFETGGKITSHRSRVSVDEEHFQDRRKSLRSESDPKFSTANRASNTAGQKSTEKGSFQDVHQMSKMMEEMQANMQKYVQLGEMFKNENIKLYSEISRQSKRKIPSKTDFFWMLFISIFVHFLLRYFLSATQNNLPSSEL